MRVFTEEITRLFNQAVEQYERESNTRLGDSNNAIFFKTFTEYVNEKTGSNLSNATVYKQVYLRLRSNSLPEVGFSLNYLNAFSQFVNKADYMQVYSVVMESESDVPEFPYPPHIPCFPATPAMRIDIPGFKDVWVKDESYNPSGTHKDRLAWEIYLFYNEYIKEQIDVGGRINIPRLSLISSGNAALSIQYLLRQNGLPNLKVIMDETTSKEYIELIRRSGCEVFLIDLSKRKLTSESILELTDNKNGYDITYGERIENIKLQFYDWLSYEVLNLNPQHLLIPYGSGDLYKNIVEICINEIKARRPSKRFFGNKNILSKCNFMGASTLNKRTKMKMLYAPHNSFKENDLKNIFGSGHIGSKSKIYEVQEKFVEPAMLIAENNKINCEPSGVAGLALFLQMKEELDPAEKYVIINTGKIKLDLF